MKTLLTFFGLIVCTIANAQLENSGALVGEYFGVALPSGNVCTTERLLVLITVKADYTLTGDVVDWNNGAVFNFNAAWPFFSGKAFSSTIVSTLEPGVKGVVSAKAGSISGVVDLRPSGGCRYTFKAYRRFKNN